VAEDNKPRVFRPNGIIYRTSGWAVLILLILLWEVSSEFNKSSSVSSFSDSFAALWKLLSGPALLKDVVPSILRMSGGFAAASIGGVLLGVVIGLYRPIVPWVQPFLEFARAVPPPLMIPIGLVIFGLGPQLVVVIIAAGAFWPVLLNTIDGTRRVEPLFLDTARALHLTRKEQILRVLLPAALPTVMAGIRIALSMSLILMVLAEMLASSTGLGHQLLIAQQTFRVSTTYGGVILLAVLGWALDTIFVLIERRVLRSHPTFQGGNDV
jgi:ABC-type nitrate/sulfonate/bicarbonate transport system permease component